MWYGAADGLAEDAGAARWQQHLNTGAIAHRPAMSIGHLQRTGCLHHAAKLQQLSQLQWHRSGSASIGNIAVKQHMYPAAVDARIPWSNGSSLKRGVAFSRQGRAVTQPLKQQRGIACCFDCQLQRLPIA